MRSLGINTDSAKKEQRLDDPRDPAIERVQRDEALASRLGIEATPTFILVVRGHQPISANAHTLPRILNSPEVQSLLVKGEGQD